MKIIQPADIIPVTGELVSNSVDKLIIATIDFDETQFPPLWQMLQNQKSAGVKIFFYTGHSFNNSRLSSNLELKDPLIIRNLNFNLVMNDQKALISTQPFGLSNSEKLEVSLLSETQEEYQEIFTYYVEFLHENASQPSSYYLLSEDTLKEKVMLRDLVPEKDYRQVSMVKKYHPLSTYISQLGYMNEDEKVGTWLLFDQDGMIEKVEKFSDGQNRQENISWDDSIEKSHLLYSFVNLIGGIYQVSIGNAGYRTFLDELIGTRNRNLLFDQIQRNLDIKFPPCAIHSMGELVDISYEQLQKRKGKAVWKKLLPKN